MLQQRSRAKIIWGLENLWRVFQARLEEQWYKILAPTARHFLKRSSGLKFYDTHESKATKTFTNRSDCKFGYRESIFKKEPGHYIVVLHVAFRLKAAYAKDEIFHTKTLADKLSNERSCLHLRNKYTMP
jgi:hypothetical protein